MGVAPARVAGPHRPPAARLIRARLSSPLSATAPGTTPSRSAPHTPKSTARREPLTVPEAVRAHAATDDGAEFLRLIGEDEDDRVVSYGELTAEAERWAAFYAARGLGAGGG